MTYENHAIRATQTPLSPAGGRRSLSAAGSRWYSPLQRLGCDCDDVPSHNHRPDRGNNQHRPFGGDGRADALAVDIAGYANSEPHD